MKLLITGAAGFLGSAVVRSAIDRGHTVVALTRGASVPGATTVVGDLRRAGSWLPDLGPIDAIIHLAASKSGDYHDQFAGTVVGTERLLDALAPDQVRRFVHISTLSVYDYAALRDNDVLDEQSPLITLDHAREDYALTKLIQEQLVHDWASRTGTELVIVRPGAVFGPGELWDAGVGELVPPLRLALGAGVTRKFVYLDNCAEAIVLAAEVPEAAGTTVNVIDDDQPSRSAYVAALKARSLPTPRAVPVPYAAWRAVAKVADQVSARRYGGRVKLPGLLNAQKLEARFKPLRYSNAAAKRILGWQPRVGLSEALDRCRAR